MWVGGRRVDRFTTCVVSQKEDRKEKGQTERINTIAGNVCRRFSALGNELSGRWKEKAKERVCVWLCDRR